MINFRGFRNFKHLRRIRVNNRNLSTIVIFWSMVITRSFSRNSSKSMCPDLSLSNKAKSSRISSFVQFRPYSLIPFLNSLQSSFLFPSSSMILNNLYRMNIQVFVLIYELYIVLFLYLESPFIPFAPLAKHFALNISIGSSEV